MKSKTPSAPKKARALSVIRRELEKHRDAIAHHRDVLRGLRNEIDDLEEPVTQAVQDLDFAIDRISEVA